MTPGDPVEFNPLPLDPEAVLPPHHPRRIGAYADVDTLADLIASLGHHCRGWCPTDDVSLDGLIGVIPRRGLPSSVALVLFDLNERPEPLVELLRILGTVNSCTHRDRIRVLPADGGRHPEPDAVGDYATTAAGDPRS
ncbi:MAG: hypothetical protein WA991_15540 [Ornithinimicrobium sp.]